MNQILDYGVGNGDNGVGKPKKNNKNYDNGNFGGGNNFGGGSNGGGKLPISDKIVKVFAIGMVLLAICLIISGVTSIMNNKDESDKGKNATEQHEEVQAEISAELNEISAKVKITVESPIIISKIIYSWDKGHENIISGEKKTTLETEIVAPYGEHVLHVQVTDEQNNKTTKDFTFDSPTGIDTTLPNVVLTVTESKKLLITATDDTSIAYVTYTWSDENGNEGETITMTPEEEGTKEYEFEIDIPRGKNTIVVYAVDGSDSANAKTASKVLEGVTKPEMTWYLTDDGSLLQITCTHEVGIKSIVYTLNGNRSSWDAPEGETWPDLSFDIVSAEGNNELVLTVTSLDDETLEWSQNWEYIKEPEPVEELPIDEQGDSEGTDEDEELPVDLQYDEETDEDVLGSDEREENN